MHYHEWKLPDGRVITVCPMFAGNGRIMEGDGVGVWNNWCYDGFDRALAAARAWDGEGEPQGWKRHVETGRRRPDGDKAQEYIHH